MTNHQKRGQFEAQYLHNGLYRSSGMLCTGSDELMWSVFKKYDRTRLQNNDDVGRTESSNYKEDAEEPSLGQFHGLNVGQVHMTALVDSLLGFFTHTKLVCHIAVHTCTRFI